MPDTCELTQITKSLSPTTLRTAGIAMVAMATTTTMPAAKAILCPGQASIRNILSIHVHNAYYLMAQTLEY